MGLLSCSQKNLPADNFLRQLKISTTSYPIPLKILFNIIMTSTPTSSKRSLYWRFAVAFHFYACYMCGVTRLYRWYCHRLQLMMLCATEFCPFSRDFPWLHIFSCDRGAYYIHRLYWVRIMMRYYHCWEAVTAWYCQQTTAAPRCHTLPVSPLTDIWTFDDRPSHGWRSDSPPNTSHLSDRITAFTLDLTESFTPRW